MQHRAIKPDYGIDAPYILTAITAAGLLCLLIAVAVPGLRFLYSPCISLLATSGVWLHGSKVGKLRLREKLIGRIVWRELSRVLKPDGTMILCDFRNTGEYTAELRKQGMDNPCKEFIGWVGFFPMVAAIVPGHRL